MQLNPVELTDFIEGTNDLEGNCQHVVDAVPEIKRHLDAMKGWAQMLYDHSTSPRPADPSRL